MDNQIILIIDDDDVDVESVQRAIKKQNLTHKFMVAHDGEDAILLLKGRMPSGLQEHMPIILLDINMPRMNGFEFLDTLRSDPIHARSVVFILTTSNNPKDRNSAYQRHVAGYLIKSEMGKCYERLGSFLNEYAQSVRLPDYLNS